MRQTREQLATRIAAVRASLKDEERARRRSGERTNRLHREVSRLRELLRMEPPTP